MSDIREIIASGVQLTHEQDDEAYALLSPEEYYAIPETQKPIDNEPVAEAVLNYTAQNLHDLQNDWCVYVVNGVFLGCCKLSQMLMIPDVSRSPTFKAVTPSNIPITISLMGQFSSDAAAKQHRDALLAAGNGYITPCDTSQQLKPHKIRCTSDETTYATVRDAAAFYDISVASVYNSLNGQRDAPRNLNFEKL